MARKEASTRVDQHHFYTQEVKYMLANPFRNLIHISQLTICFWTSLAILELALVDFPRSLSVFVSPPPVCQGFRIMVEFPRTRTSFSADLKQQSTSAISRPGPSSASPLEGEYGVPIVDGRSWKFHKSILESRHSSCGFATHLLMSNSRLHINGKEAL